MPHPFIMSYYMTSQSLKSDWPNLLSMVNRSLFAVRVRVHILSF